MTETEIRERIKELCEEFDSRVKQIGLEAARYELIETLVRCEKYWLMFKSLIDPLV